MSDNKWWYIERPFPWLPIAAVLVGAAVVGLIVWAVV